MGQMGSPKALLWMLSNETPDMPVLISSHGIRRQWAGAVGCVYLSNIFKLGFDQGKILDADEVRRSSGSTDDKLMKEAQIELFAPILARGKLIGIIALGRKVSGEVYSEVDHKVLKSSLGMLGVTLENTRLYNNVLEQHRQLRQAHRNLAELDRLKSEFLRNVNHELRTPLTIIMAYAESLLEEERENAQAREFLDTIRSESEKLAGLVENLLDFSAVCDDKLKIQSQAGDITQLLTPFFRLRLPGVSEGLRELRLSLGDAAPLTRFDAERVTQVLDVLVDNAVNFTPQGSRVVLSLDKMELDGVIWTRIDVEDDGPGISPERLEQLFESFRQGDGTTTREVGGMGMGLAFAKQLAEGMGGRLTVVSELGKGSTFSLWLPAAEFAEVEPPEGSEMDRAA